MGVQRFFFFPKALSAIIAAFILFSAATPFAAYAHNQTCCCNQESAELTKSHCKDMPDGHEHKASDCSDVCHLGHCHSAHGSFMAQPKISTLRIYSPKNLRLLRHKEQIYLSPHLGKPLQPPKA